MTDRTPERHVPGWLKTALELGPVVGFFVAYLLYKDETFTVAGAEYGGLVAVTAIFIPVILLSTAILWALTGKLSNMQIFTAVLVTVFGGLAIWLNDERFIKIRPTLVYGLFALILGFGLWRGKSYPSLVLAEAFPLTAEGWTILTRRMTGLFALMALSNEIVWRTMSEQTWVVFETFGLPAAMFAFFIAQAPLLQKHSADDGTS